MKKINPSSIYINDYTYSLPQEKIADFPLAERDQSRLLIYQQGHIQESVFNQLPQYLPPGTALVLNNTRVIEARLLFQKSTGGIIEIFCLEPAGKFKSITDAMGLTEKVEWNCLIGGASKWKPGQVLHKEVLIEGTALLLSAKYLAKKQDAFVIEFSWSPADYSFAEVLHQAGAIPLPPYIKRKAQTLDSERYQTIFAQNQGSVAAPTAALHFTDAVFSALKQKNIHPQYLTLHVGAGTFKPVKTQTIAEHQMHAEQFEVSIATLKSLLQHDQLVAVGTTSLRTLESLYWIGIKILQKKITSVNDIKVGQWEAYELENEGRPYKESLGAIIKFLEEQKAEMLFCETSLLILPGYEFHSVRGLITNFHQPQSTLLLLVAAFIGDDWKQVYKYALQNEFRFLSYGDSSLLWRK